MQHQYWICPVLSQHIRHIRLNVPAIKYSISVHMGPWLCLTAFSEEMCETSIIMELVRSALDMSVYSKGIPSLCLLDTLQFVFLSF